MLGFYELGFIASIGIFELGIFAGFLFVAVGKNDFSTVHISQRSSYFHLSLIYFYISPDQTPL